MDGGSSGAGRPPGFNGIGGRMGTPGILGIGGIWGMPGILGIGGMRGTGGRMDDGGDGTPGINGGSGDPGGPPGINGGSSDICSGRTENAPMETMSPLRVAAAVSLQGGATGALDDLGRCRGCTEQDFTEASRRVSAAEGFRWTRNPPQRSVVACRRKTILPSPSWQRTPTRAP